MIRLLCCALGLLPLIRAADQPSAADTASALRAMSVDPEQTYRVRDLTLSRGDIKIYLTEGILSFATPIESRSVAAVFSTSGVEAGDAEIILLPPQRAERASLASFTNRPNLDEHFTSALFLFTDDTYRQLLSEIQEAPVHKAPELAPGFFENANSALRMLSSGIDVHVIQSLLDNHTPDHGVFYASIFGRELGVFEAMYEPDEFEPVAVGRATATRQTHGTFQLWTSFRPKRAPPFLPHAVALSDFQIGATIHDDLSMSVTSRFNATPAGDSSRVLSFGLSERLNVTSATIDGKAAEVFQRSSLRSLNSKGPGAFLLVSADPIASGQSHRIQIDYNGSVIRETPDGLYFVDERNAWVPFAGSLPAYFDLTFRCPQQLRLVSTGELVSEEVVGHTRIVHRKTLVPERLTGFNLGKYETVAETHGQYRIECYANAQLRKDLGGTLQTLSNATETILDDYTQRWVPLPIRSIAVSPIPGYFGQGFPGLIYLSTMSYLKEEERPRELRNAQMNTFFSDMLLPHEVAHQWWGNMVSPADYRSEWLMEAMANYSALQFVERTKSPAAMHDVLAGYRDDLAKKERGKSIESAGPVDFGVRLEAIDLRTWHTIVYKKGTWVLHMLRERLGESGFRSMQLALLRDLASKPITNEDFRRVASDFVAPGQPDKSLVQFFDTWVYGTGVPALRLQRTGRTLKLEVSGVDEDFIADVPLECTAKAGTEQVRWVRASSGENPVELSSRADACQLPAATSFLYSAY